MSQIRSSPMVLVAAALTMLTAACSNDSGGTSFAGGVDTPNESRPPATEPSTTTTPMTSGSIILSPDGLGPVAFGTQAAVALNGLTQAFGRAEQWSLVPAGGACAATRIFTWKNFEVLVNEATSTSSSTRGLVGWALRGTEPTLDLRTEKGVGIGSRVAAARAAYGDSLESAQGPGGPTLTIPGSSGSITAELDRLGDAGKIQTLRAGTACAV
jgi:hypothetical protein